MSRDEDKTFVQSSENEWKKYAVNWSLSAFNNNYRFIEVHCVLNVSECDTKNKMGLCIQS